MRRPFGWSPSALSPEDQDKPSFEVDHRVFRNAVIEARHVLENTGDEQDKRQLLDDLGLQFRALLEHEGEFGAREREAMIERAHLQLMELTALAELSDQPPAEVKRVQFGAVQAPIRLPAVVRSAALDAPARSQ